MPVIDAQQRDIAKMLRFGQRSTSIMETIPEQRYEIPIAKSEGKAGIR